MCPLTLKAVWKTLLFERDRLRRMRSTHSREIPAAELYATRTILISGLIRFSTKLQTIICLRGVPTTKRKQRPTSRKLRYESSAIPSSRSVCRAAFSVRRPQHSSKPAVTAQGPQQTHQEMQQALTSLQPRCEVPTSLSVVFLDTPEHGPVLTASIQVTNDTLSYEEIGGKPVAAVDVVGVAVNDKGKPVETFQTRLKIDATDSRATAQDDSVTIYNYRMPITPGLYQVRVATRDSKSGQVGSAQQWIEIPNLSLRRLSLSSLLLGLQNVKSKETKGSAAGIPQVQFSTDHHFARNSRLRFITFIYNAARGQTGNSPPNISLQARVLRAGQVVKSSPMQQVSVAAQDFARIPYGGEISLDSLPAGQYLL
jgi:hypothetical protein